MEIYQFDDYRDYLKEFIHNSPQKGYGKLAEMAESCNMNPATITLVLKKDRDFTIDQGFDIGSFLGLNSFEMEYFLTSINLQRAGKVTVRSFLKRKLNDLKKSASDLQKRMGESKDLDENAKAQFYSHWIYSATRLATSIEDYQSIDEISKRLKIPRATIRTILDFLFTHGLVKIENEKYKMAIQSTHLSANSPLVIRHHQNWRLKAFGKMENIEADELFFTSPVSIAKKDIPLVREKLVQALDEVFKVIDPSKEEELACLNIDWFKI
jgi:uncharacterized protein (TIGR02147 family)